MNATTQAPEEKRYYFFNPVTGLWWNGRGFNGKTKTEKGYRTFPAKSLPLMKSVWKNVEAVVANF